MSAFIDAISSADVASGDGADGHRAWTVPDGWQQGRGAWGGLVVGAMVRAVMATETDTARPVRTVSAHLFGPTVAGDARIAVRPIRIGSAMSTWSVEVSDETGAATANAVIITGLPRATELTAHYESWGTALPPTLPDWRSIPVAPVRPPLGPAFAEHVEYRVVEGLPFSGSAARTSGWLRFPDQGEWTADQLLGIVDAWWPCAMAALPTAHPMATVSFAAHLLIDPATIPAGEPLRAEASLSAAYEGFTSETRRLWTADGRLAIENHQSIVVIR